MKTIITLILAFSFTFGYSQDTLITPMITNGELRINAKVVNTYYTIQRVGVPKYSINYAVDGTQVNDTIFANRVVFEGDSWSIANGGWTQYLGDSTYEFARMHYVNYAVGGETTSGMSSQYATQVATQKSTGATDATYLFIYGGINDILASTSAITSFTNLKSVYQSARTDNFKVTAFTVPKLGALSAGQELIRKQLNDSIRSRQDLYDYLVETDLYFDYTTVPALWANVTHLNEVGYRKLASLAGKTVFPSKSTNVVLIKTEIDKASTTLNFGSGIGFNDVTKTAFLDTIAGRFINSATTTITGQGTQNSPISINVVGGSGEINTASNVGTVGVGIFKQKVGVNLELYKLAPATNKLTIVQNGTDRIDIGIVEANLSGIPQSAVTNLTTDLAGKALKVNTPIALTDAVTTTWDYNVGVIATWVIAGNRTLSITNDVSGTSGAMLVTQDATGGRTITFPVGDNLSGVTQNTAANAITMYSYLRIGTVRFWNATLR